MLSACRLPCPSLCDDVTDAEHLPQSGRRLKCSHSNVAVVEVSSNVPEKKLIFSTTCVDILMHNFLTAIAQLGVIVSCFVFVVAEVLLRVFTHHGLIGLSAGMCCPYFQWP